MPVSTKRTHYAVLGVPPTAGTDEIRRAHRQLARVLHPDRQGGATDAERRLAERRMREVNAAWTVLSEPGRRAAYDASLATATARGRSTEGRAGDGGPAAPRDRSAGEGAVDDDPDDAWARAREEEIDPDEPELAAWQFWLLRRGPIVVALVVAAVLFVLTAYAGGGNSDAGTTGSPNTTVGQDCVRLTEGRNAARASCVGEHDGRIVTRVARALDCPGGTSYVLVDGAFVCVTTDPALRSNVLPGGG